MNRITPFNDFNSGINEAGSIERYTTDDVRNAFADVESDLSDYYSVDDDSVKITLEWNLKYGDLDVESSLDSIEFEFDTTSFIREILRNLSHDEDTKGPTFTKDEISSAIDHANYNKDIFLDNFRYNVNNADTEIEVDENRYSTELTVKGKLVEDSVSSEDYDIDSEGIIDGIIEELLKGVARRIDFT
jgi:hypothetical protein